MRKHPVSQYSEELIGIAVFEAGELQNADGDVLLTITRDSDDFAILINAVATNDGVGLYSYILDSVQTQEKGSFTATWNYDFAGDPRIFAFQFEIVDAMPHWDSLEEEHKMMVDNIYHKVSDGFDSTQGGPYVWEMPQSHFNFDTIAKLMMIDALTYLNYSPPKAFIPPFTIGINGGGGPAFPVNWYGLLERATGYELYKHLATSYLEIPEPVGVNVAHLDRREYYDRWMKRAEIEKEELDHMIKMLKREFRFGVKSRSMLLAGGIFPVSYLNPARPRWPYVLTRFY